MKYRDMTKEQQAIVDENYLEAIDSAESALRAASITSLVSHPFFLVLENEHGMRFRCGCVDKNKSLHGFGDLEKGFPTPSFYTQAMIDELVKHFSRDLQDGDRLFKCTRREWAVWHLQKTIDAANAFVEVTDLEY